MTMPHEELNALKRAHVFLVQQCLWQTPWSMLWLILTGRFQKWRKDAYWCLRHYPYDCKLDRLYLSDVCPDCYQTRNFCKCKKEND